MQDPSGPRSSPDRPSLRHRRAEAERRRRARESGTLSPAQLAIARGARTHVLVAAHGQLGLVAELPV